MSIYRLSITFFDIIAHPYRGYECVPSQPFLTIIKDALIFIYMGADIHLAVDFLVFQKLFQEIHKP